MNRLLELLREKPWAWGVPLALLLINLMLLSTYRAIYSGRVAVLEAQILDEQQDLEELRGLTATVEAKVEQVVETRAGIEQLYQETFATEQERLTQLIREVRQLAVQAGLRPDSIAYPQEQLEDFGLFERSINFGVEGSYDSLRRFVNFLELSDSFVVLRSLGLTANNQQQVRIALSLTTLFSGRDLATEPSVGIELEEDA